MSKKVDGITFGCRLNFHETEILKSKFRNTNDNSDIIIINTCSVTHEAERQSKQAVRKCLRENPNAKIVVTGCAAKTAAEYFSTLPVEILPNDQKEMILTEIDQHIFEDRSRAFLQIQNGCDHFCTYCIIPFTRGRSRSVPLVEIIKSIKGFVIQGFKEIVLSGIDISSYGKDIDIELADVLDAICKHVPELNRIRISSIDPAAISDRLLDIICTNEKILPHMHLSVQSGDNMILRSMHRRHSREDVISLCQKIREKRNDFVFGSDFIVGFPGESDEMFENTVKLVSEANISLLHVFPFSPRTGTKAAQFIQLPNTIVHERAKFLRNVGDKAVFNTLQKFVGKTVGLLVEKPHYGKTDRSNNIKRYQKFFTL